MPGIYKAGRIELLGPPPDLREGSVMVTLEGPAPQTAEPELLPYGRYTEGHESTEDDFLIAESSL